MRVVLIDTIGSWPAERSAEPIVKGLTDDPRFATVIHVRWPGGRSDHAGANGRDPSEKLAETMWHADAVVTLPWTAAEPISAIDRGWLHRCEQICQAVEASGVQAFVFASSSLGYGPNLSREPVVETWPMTGLRDAPSSMVLAETDELVEGFERDHPVVRVVRLRFAPVVDPDWADTSARHRLTDWRAWRRLAATRSSAPISILHADDLADAYRLALTTSVSGPVNLAGPPTRVTDLARRFGAGRDRRRPSRWPVAGAFPAAWLELARRSPVLDTGRATEELGFAPRPILEGRRSAGGRRPAGWSPSVGGRAGEAVVSDFRARSLYAGALGFFGAGVDALETEWKLEVWPGVTAADLVATAARDQYRMALILSGRSEELAEAESPTDPLGLDRADGWHLAAGQAREALAARRADLPSAPLGQASPLGRVLADAAADLLAWGWCLARVVDGAPTLEGEPLEFLRDRAVTGHAPGGAPPVLLPGGVTAGPRSAPRAGRAR